MRKITVEAFEDESRPQGGHAVILLHGLDNVPAGTTFRLRPVDASQHTGDRAWRSASLAPITTRVTDRGVEFVVGPDVVSNPMLLSGTPVVIELPDAGVRGEFLWPNVAPLAPPRRRHLVVPRRPRRHEATAIAPPELPAPADRPYRNGNAGAQAYAGSSLRSAEAATQAKPDPVQSAVVVPLRPEPTREIIIPEAEPLPAAETKPQPLTVTEAAAILDVEPVLIKVADKEVAPDPAEASTAATSTAAVIAEPPWDTPAPSRRSELPQWTPGKQTWPLGGSPIVYGAAGIVALLGVAVWAMASRKSEPVPAPTIAGTAQYGSASPQANGGPSGAPGNKDGTGPSAALVGTAPAIKAGAVACGEPEIATEPLAGGRMKLTVKADCRPGQEVRLAYGGATLRYKLDSAGSLSTVLDCFAGASSPVELQVGDSARKSVPVTALDLDRVTKVAVVWQAPVNLDLHAFEYAALPGGKGHVWAGSPGSAAVAKDANDKRGHGFLSTADGGQSLGDKVEVYTFFHDDTQTSGAVTLALDYASRGETPADAACGKGALAEIPYWVGVLKRGASFNRENGLIAAATCGSKIGADVRFNQSVLPVIRIRK